MARDIRQFYAHSRGRMILRHIRPIIKDWWPDIEGLRVLGYGMTQHYLSPYKKSKHETLTLLARPDLAPEAWPKGGSNKLAVCEDDKIPLETQSIDRIMAVHALETSDVPRRLLAELWRVLDGEGRMILVVPHRAGLWARAENTPFGQGRPYSIDQLARELSNAGFSIDKMAKALYMPSGRSRFLISLAPMFEKIGRILYPAFGGVIIIEAEKTLLAPRQKGLGAPVTAGLDILSPKPATDSV